MSDNLDMIYDLLKQGREDASDFRKEVKDTQKAVSDKLTEIQVVTSERLSKIEALDEIQNLHLSEHMRRTDVLEKLHRDNQFRIENLEKPAAAFKTISKWIVGVGALAGAIATVIKLIS
jgi:hypothetical protein